MTERIQQYFEELHQKLSKAYAVAQKARLKGFDPQDKVELRITKNMAERVVGLISVIAPQIANEKIVERILQLERTYGALDWRIALTIAEEVAEGRFCTFQSKKEAMEVGIRTGLAYVTLGVVSAPLDGFVGLELKQRTDGGGEYFCLNFAGPMRNAGGTAMAVSVLIADYVRRKMGYASYDATDEEVKRAITELQDYHERVTNLQYNPSPEELAFLIKNLPVEIGGEPSEKIEVSNYRDLPRIPTNYIRSGYCLVLSAGLSLKAPKLYKQISAWGKDFGLDGWNWLADFIKIQKSVKAKGEQKKGPLEPDYTYLNDLVAGRPVLGNPLAAGAFRLRYGRTRTSGYSAQAVHPATMEILNNFLAIGTQLKLERPSKSTAITICDTIEGPIVKLQDGSVLFLETQEMANAVKQKISEILFLGDILISYGDFNNRAQPLAPVGYCEEWWIKELEKAMVESFGSIDCSKLSELCEIPETFLERLLKAPLTTKPTALQAVSLSKKLTIPLHPRYTFHWKDISLEQLKSLLDALPDAKISKSNGIVEKIELPNKNGVKRTLELVGVPHRLDEGKIVVEKDWALALAVSFSLTEKDVKWLSSATSKVLIEPQTDTLAVVNKLSEVFLRDKSGTYIGARMGRPEKANMRQLVGSPNCLFPVGKEGGKLRAVQSALEVGKIVAEAMIWWCPLCNKSRLYRVCEVCGSRTEHRYYCEGCKQVVMQQNCPRHGPAKDYMQQVINIKEIFSALIKKLGMQVYPDIIKGVRGTSNEKHFVEHLAKGILRAKWSLTVNKDGTIRYDASELPITHF
ncbi:MAG: DNA polymerase II large subunit, partial [Candidatus Woesearchaeota archaeon]